MSDRLRTGLDWEDVRFFTALARLGSLSATARALGVNHAHGGAPHRRAGGGARRRAVRAPARRLRPDRPRPCRARGGERHGGRRPGLAGAGPSQALAGLVRLTTTPGLADGFLIPRLGALGRRCPGLDMEIIADRRRWSTCRATRPPSPCASAGPTKASSWRGGWRRSASASMPRRPGASAWRPEPRRPSSASTRPAPTCRRRWQLGRRFPRARFALRSNNQLSQAAAARADCGIAVLPHVLAGDLVALDLAEPPPARELWLLTRPDIATVPRIRRRRRLHRRPRPPRAAAVRGRRPAYHAPVAAGPAWRRHHRVRPSVSFRGPAGRARPSRRRFAAISPKLISTFELRNRFPSFKTQLRRNRPLTIVIRNEKRKPARSADLRRTDPMISPSSAAASMAAASPGTRPGAGCRCCCCEQNDLASGTSSASDQADPWRPALSRILRVPPGARGADGARGAAGPCAPHIIWPLRFVLPHHAGPAPGLAAAPRPVPLRPSRRPQAACRRPARSTSPATSPATAEAGRLRQGFEYSDCLGRGRPPSSRSTPSMPPTAAPPSAPTPRRLGRARRDGLDARHPGHRGRPHRDGARQDAGRAAGPWVADVLVLEAARQHVGQGAHGAGLASSWSGSSTTIVALAPLKAAEVSSPQVRAILTPRARALKHLGFQKRIKSVDPDGGLGFVVAWPREA